MTEERLRERAFETERPSPICTHCERPKAPRGRSIPLQAHGLYCAADMCGSWPDEPHPSTLWPGEHLRETSIYGEDLRGLIAQLDQLRADHEDLQNEADGMADINGRLSGEVILLQDAVWSDGRPWVDTHYAQSCKFCFARMPYGTSEADQQQHYPHKCGCAWFAEDKRREAGA